METDLFQYFFSFTDPNPDKFSQPGTTKIAKSESGKK